MNPQSNTSLPGLKRVSERTQSPEISKKKKKNLNHELIQVVLSDLCNSETTLKDLHEKGADINYEDPEQNDLTPLAFAVLMKRFEIVPLLLKYGANVKLSDAKLKDIRGLVTSDYAIINQNYEIVSLLLENDAAFPINFENETLGLPFQVRLPLFREIMAERFKLHENIKNGNLHEVQKFVAENPELKCAYDVDNHCVLSTALASKQFEIYCFLYFEGFQCGVHTDDKKLKKSLNADEKLKLENLIGQHFKYPEDKHVSDLSSKSKMFHKDDSGDFKKIIGFFEQLNEIEELKPILKIAAGPVKEIVFDFKAESVRNLDLAAYYVEDVRGRTYYDKGRILIGAKRENKHVLGTLAHELTHLVLNLVYENKCLPFYATDETRKQKFEEIVNAYDNEEMTSKSDIIKAVYNNEKMRFKCIELAARVNHLIALHHLEPKKLAKLRIDFKDLFEFHSNCILPDFQNESLQIDAKQEVRSLNNALGFLAEIESFPYDVVKPKIHLEDLNNSCNMAIQCNVPELALKAFITKKCPRSNPKDIYIFVKQEQLKDSGRKILKIHYPELRKIIFVLCTETLSDSDKNVLRHFQQPDKVVLVSKLQLNSPYENLSVKYSWNDLTTDSKDNFLMKKIQFQSQEMTVDSILNEESALFNDLSLEEIFEIPNTSIACKQFNTEMYIERSYQIGQKQSTFSADEIIQYLVSYKTLILSDDAGSGKSMSAKNLTTNFKQKYPSYWIVFVDLKLFTKLFCENDQRNRQIDIVNIFSNKPLKLDGKIRRKLFDHCFQTKKVFFAFDGFDEICPNYKNFALNLMSTVQKSGNFLLVATRIFHAKELEEELQTTAVKLKPFSEGDQIEFLMKHWKNLDESLDDQTLRRKANSLLSQESVPKEFFSRPLQLYLLAEINEKIGNARNAYSLYYSFIEKKVENWLSKGMSVVKEETNFIMKSISSMHVHQKLALDSLLLKPEEIEPFSLPLIKDDSIVAVINRVGLIKITGSNIQFLHQTLIEYFVAYFIVNNVARKTTLRSKKTLVRLFLKVLRTIEYRKIRKFINEGLEAMSEKNEIDHLSKKFEDNFREETDQDVLERITIEEQTCLIAFVLQDLKISKNAKFALLRRKNKEQSEILHVATSHFESFRTLWKCIENFADEDEQKSLLQATGAIKRNVICWAVLNEQVLKFVLESILAKMSSQCWLELLLKKDQESNTALHIIALNRHSSILYDLWEGVKNKLTKQEQKTWFGEVGEHNETILQSLARDDNLKILPAALRVAEEIFNEQEICDFLLAKDYKGSTVFHSAAHFSRIEVLNLIWRFACKKLSLTSQKSLLASTLRHGHNIFIKAFRNRNEGMVKYVLGIASEILDPEELWEILKSRNYYGNSVLSLTEDYTSEIFPKELIAKIKNELQKARPEENIPVLLKLKSQIREITDDETFKELILAKTEGKTNLQLAVQFGSLNLLKTLMFKLNQSDIKELFLPNLMHFCLNNKINNYEAPKYLWSFVLEKLSKEDALEVISGEDAKKRNIITFGILINCPTVYELAQFYKSCDVNKFKDRFFEKNQNGDILIHYIAKFSNATMTEKFFGLILETTFEDEERKEMLLTKNSFRRTPLHRALKGRDKSTLQVFYNNYKLILHADGLNRMLFHNDLDYFNYGNHKTEELVDFLRFLATRDFGDEKVSGKIRSIPN